MFKAIVLIWVIHSPNPVIIDDKLGPYTTALDCFHRGAVIIRSVVDITYFAIAKAEAICLEKKKEPPKEELSI